MKKMCMVFFLSVIFVFLFSVVCPAGGNPVITNAYTADANAIQCIYYNGYYLSYRQLEK
jgi:hypothetical protein